MNMPNLAWVPPLHAFGAGCGLRRGIGKGMRVGGGKGCGAGRAELF
jgi:hypothetical protein